MMWLCIKAKVGGRLALAKEKVYWVAKVSEGLGGSQKRVVIDGAES
jgi:hypothetical protein